MLAAGGDARIALDPVGLNRYGCPPWPDPGLAAFGSATASVISTAGFAAADRLRQELLSAHLPPGPKLYARELDRLRRELPRLCGVGDMPGLEVIFCASGTDAHLLAGQLLGGGDRPALVLMVDAAETGAGVAAALAGRHFSERAALGAAVAEGAVIAGAEPLEVAAIPLRRADGTPRPLAEVDGEAEIRVAQAVGAGRRVLLVLADVSKTGRVAPGPVAALAWRGRWPDAVEVLVDACQFRLAPASLRAYLARDCWVALTGSKFVAGPTFSGALLVSAAAARRLRERPLPVGLGGYSARADWPANWTGAETLPEAANFGLLLRWAAALEELRAFRAVPDAVVEVGLGEFAAVVRGRLADDPAFMPLPTPGPERGGLVPAPGWDRIPSVFPFLPRRPGSLEAWGREDTARIYRLARGDPGGTAGLRVQLGQPVACGVRDGLEVAALRLCASARLAVELAAEPGAVLQRAMAALDAVAYWSARR